MQILDFITGKTKLAGLIGNPIEHTASPQLHNTLYSSLNLNYVYMPFKIEAPELKKAVTGLKALGVIGFNVTVPYKRDIIKFLDEVSREAILMGAVNTVKITSEGTIGYNTDAEGFLRSFKEETGVGPEGKKIMLIGSGGAARAVGIKLAMEKAGEIAVVNRNMDKAFELASLINNNIAKVSHVIDREILENPGVPVNYDIIINTTSAGMHPEEGTSPVGDNFGFSGRQIVYDVIYNPVMTRFLNQAQKKGCKTVNGLGMLFYQGISAFEIWTGIKVPQEILQELKISFMNYIKK